MKRLGFLLSVVIWMLIGGSVVVLAGGLFGRPLLLAAVPTGSMVPTMTPGDLIVVLPTWAMHGAGIGDVVVFKTPQDRNWIVHRIVNGNVAEGFVTKGDANHSPDSTRVFPRDIVGIVPQVQGTVLHMPRLGALSIGNGPLSSPIVAGVALVMGVYLLVLDARPRFHLPHRAPRKSAVRESAPVVSIYLGLAATVFITSLVPAWTISAAEPIKYEVVQQRPEGVTKEGQYLRGMPHSEEVTIRNPSPLPLVVVFHAEDPAVVYDPGWAIIGPKGSKIFQLKVDTPEVGTFKSYIRMGVFLPLLPPALLAVLTGLGLPVAALAVSLVPTAFVLGFAMIDDRSRTSIQLWWLRVTARYIL